MAAKNPRFWAVLALVAAALGLLFSAYSTFDYTAHLDRQINHAIHCSFIPGAPTTTEADNPCRAAMYSPYSAILREKYWGGIPISLFALGSFSFFVAFALYLVLAGARAPKRAHEFLAVVGTTPFVASVVMFFISLIRLGAFCKVCVGIYMSSTLLAAAGILGWLSARKPAPGAPPARAGSPLLWVAWLATIGIGSVLPTAVYIGTLPDFRPYLASCGKLGTLTESHGALVKATTAQPTQPVTMFVDPLCPTCKAFHERLVAEGIFEKLDVQLALMPLDSECNWMLNDALHPGACLLSRAVLCGGPKAREVLEWSYANQEDLRNLGRGNKAGKEQLKARIAQQWGKDLAACVDAKTTQAKLNQNLQFAVANHVQVSTPQMYLGDLHLCDEDTDLGLRYAFGQLAPQVLP